jgi:Xaa-Pro aminopeptidase
MARHGLGATLIIYRPNYFYFSGTSQNAILYIPLEKDPILFVRRDMDRAQEESPLLRVLPLQSLKQLPDVIESHAGTIPQILGVELDVLPAQEFFRFQEVFRGVEFKNSSPVIMKCRMKKTAFEIEQIKKAARIAYEVYEAGKNLLQLGMREIEFGALFEMEAKRRGHEGVIRMRGLNYEGYSWHILSGPSGSIVSDADTPAGGSGLSPAFPTGAGWRKIQAHEPILVDFAICCNGYISDQSRIYSIGELPEKFLKAYKVCREIENLVLKGARPGVKSEDVFLIANRLAFELGYEDGFLGLPGKKAKFVGHGIGLEANEIPVLGVGQEYPLEAGVVLAIEPKIVFPGEGVVGIENMYLIKEEGYEKLTLIDDEIIQV